MGGYRQPLLYIGGGSGRRRESRHNKLLETRTIIPHAHQTGHDVLMLRGHLEGLPVV